MTNQELYRVAPVSQPTADSLRTIILILATVLVGFAVTATVPDQVWSDLSAVQHDSVPDWHGNVAAYTSR